MDPGDGMGVGLLDAGPPNEDLYAHNVPHAPGPLCTGGCQPLELVEVLCKW